MSISSKRGPGTVRTTRQEELRLFVDRHRYVREFIEALHSRPPREQVLFFYGVGGVGKSLMLRYLQEHGCQLVEPGEWSALQALGDEEFRSAFESAPGAAVPIALHDFSAHAVGDDPCDPFHGPLMLRSQLGRLGFRFPRFDFAVILFAQHRNFSSEKVASLLPSSDAGVTAELLEFLVENSRVASVASFVASKLFDRYGETASLAYAKHRAPEEVIAEIYGLEIDTELVPWLPRYLAEDINEALAAREARGKTPADGRLCLFFDTHDAFWAERHFGGSDAQRNVRDEWFRSLLSHLDLERTLVVVTGRERPRWASAVREAIPAEYLHLIAVGDLDPHDASLYLEQRGIAAEDDRERIISALSTETGLHPLSLGLAADLVGRGGDLGEISTRSLAFADIGPGLLDRLLSYLPAEECQAITALGACRSFDRDLYLYLGQQLAFRASVAAYSEIKQLSFVIPVQSEGAESFKIHTVLRKSLIESTGDLVQAAHVSLAAHYAEGITHSGDSAHLEHLFHVSRVLGRRDEAVTAWLRLMAEAVDDGDVPLLMRVLGLEDEFVLQSWQERARLAHGRKYLYASQGRDDDSRSVLDAAILEGRGLVRGSVDEQDRLLLAELLLQLGWVLRYRTESEEGTAAFREAVDLVREGSAAADHMRGRLYFGWAGIPSDAGDVPGSRAHLESASRAYGYALRRTETSPQMRWISDASSTETALARDVLLLDGPAAAEPLARRAVHLAEQAVEMEPDDVRALANLEGAYAALSACLTDRDVEQALALADLSLATCRRASRLEVGWGERPVQRLLARAALRQRAGDVRGAVDDEDQAVASALELVDRQPRHRHSHHLLALALQRQSLRAEGAGRAELLQQAVEVVRQCLAIAPGWQEANRLHRELLASLASTSG